jgi:hypothetical protein
MVLGRRRRAGLFAIGASTASAPQDVCGAAMFSLRSHTEITSGHAARGNRADVHKAGKREKSAPRGCVSLDNGGPHKG